MQAHLDDEALTLALREARLLRASEHPNIVGVRPELFRNQAGQLCMCMEHVGRTLGDELRSHSEGWRGFSAERVKLVAWQLLQATAFLHCCNVRASLANAAGKRRGDGVLESDFKRTPSWHTGKPETEHTFNCALIFMNRATLYVAHGGPH